MTLSSLVNSHGCREESSYRHRVDDVRPCTRTERPSDMSRDGLRIESVVASPENGENCGWLPKIFFNGPRHRKTTRLAVVCSLRHALNCLGLESHRHTHNPHHRRDMLSTSIKFPIAAGNSETTTTPQYHRSRPGRSEGARLRTWTRALPTKCTPRPMPQGDLSP